MSINKIGVLQPSTPASGDWDKLISATNAYTKQLSGLQYPLSGAVLKQSSYIQHGGVLYQVQSGDYTILGSLTAGVFNYVKIAVGGENLVATWVTDISSYSWSNEYNYLIAVDGSQIMATTERDGVVYRLEGKNEIYKSYETNQNTKTTDDVIFNNIVAQIGIQTFGDIQAGGDALTMGNATVNGNSTVGGAIYPRTNPVSGSYTIPPMGSWIPPRGMYVCTFLNSDGSLVSDSIEISINSGTTFYGEIMTRIGITLLSDGNKVRLYNHNGTYSATVKYLKF